MKKSKTFQPVLYSKLKSDFIVNDEIKEESPFSKVFNGLLKEKN